MLPEWFLNPKTAMGLWRSNHGCVRCVWHWRIAGLWKESWECCAEAVLAVSVHRAKGLDRWTVVVTGLRAWEEAFRDA
jgi:hypothetical protein